MRIRKVFLILSIIFLCGFIFSVETLREKPLYIEDTIYSSDIIEEEGGIDCMQEEYGDEWWFSNTFCTLGEEKYFSRLRYLWCTPLHGFWKKYQICLQDFCEVPGCADFPQSVIVEFENTPSVMELLYTKCQIGYGLHQEKGTNLSIIRFIESNVELFGFEDTLNVKNIY